MFGGNGLSLADIAAVTRGNGNGSNDFGGNNGWWILIILFALFGWGRGGYGDGAGSGGNGNQPVVYSVGADMQRGFDTSAITTKLDGLSNGLCSLGYDQLGRLNDISSRIQACCCNIENLIQQSANSTMTAITALGNQVTQCCCDLRAGQQQAEYNRATDTCTITTAIDRMADRIIQNDNANFRSLYDQQVQMQMEALRRENAALQARLNTCDTQNMINASAQYVVSTLNPPPVPSYTVPNPNTGCCYQQRTCCNNGGWTGGF